MRAFERTLELPVSGRRVAQQFVYAANVIQGFNQFPLKSGTLVDLLCSPVFSQGSVVSSEPNQRAPLAFVPVRFLFRQAGFVRNLERAIERCQ